MKIRIARSQYHKVPAPIYMDQLANITHQALAARYMRSISYGTVGVAMWWFVWHVWR